MGAWLFVPWAKVAVSVVPVVGGGREFQAQGLGLCDTPGSGEGELLRPGGEVDGE
ncbi:MAG: hypothetical protein HQ453_01140 [Actinobacteria bacterium]|nr:hypothetical protein [Actinomycetota bacterium]